VEPDWSEVFHGEGPGDGKLSHAVEQESEQVVERRRDKASVRDPGCASLAIVEAVDRADTGCRVFDAKP
jgi:hypothetical protein